MTVARERLTVCVGAGGVGKTTVAAALALARARQGERVAVVTIDPAPALARALGLAVLGGEPQRVEGAGELWAMRLDAKRTLDELISSLAADEGARDRALSNRIYRELSAAVAGSQEFSAVAKLYELDRSGLYDAIVLDTPPSRNALDFLDAPARLMRFFDGRAARVLMSQGGSATRVAARAGAPLLGVLGRLAGAGVLREIVAFFSAIGGMVEGLGARAAAVEALLHDPATSFVLVTSPRREAVEEAIAFAAALAQARLPLSALAVNRVHMAANGDADGSLEALLGARLAELVRESVRELGDRAAADGDSLARLRAALPGLPTVLIPELGAEMSNLAELDRLGAYLKSVGSPSVAQ
ncbi:MAG TPA: ArsA-related P-loop ATPase [Solirubrobacteraceae bacterium]|jgi:anion-transporting  ArsA/GET3 family ATPase|nr:ArsA-related P-loop ATPase [Solirubrobacteraceae bacterium]